MIKWVIIISAIALIIKFLYNGAMSDNKIIRTFSLTAIWLIPPTLASLYFICSGG